MAEGLAGPDGLPVDPCVVHLVWAPLGIEPFRRFLASYLGHPAGLPHRLCILFNGFGSRDRADPYRDLLVGVDHRELFLTRPMMDIAAYMEAARSLEASHLCFLNSHAVILEEGWLAKLARHAARESVGLAGATGSFESNLTHAIRHNPRPRLRLGPRRLAWIREVRNWRRHWIHYFKTMKHYRASYLPFPNPHLRTNAFMIRRDLMLRVEAGNVESKEDAYRFESGKESLTRQVSAMGLEVLVVGRDGVGYKVDDWPSSGTFRVGDQANLLVSDNQTRIYQEASPEDRRAMSSHAWGEGAAPAVPLGDGRAAPGPRPGLGGR